MFDVRGDTILFDGRKVATLHALPVVGIRIDVERALLDWQDPAYLVTEDEHVKACDEACDEAREEGYNSGSFDGEKRGRLEAEEECDKRVEEATAEAYKDGQANALTDMEHAQDAVRVGELLAALKKAHDALLIFQGIQEPGTYHKRPAKLSECKRAMASAASTLRCAILNYERPNGA